MTDEIRVRYAPSPTGEPHVGNIRTALFNWLLARKTGGNFIVRIEDTDTERTIDGGLASILNALKWLGLDWDEGPEVGGQYGPYIQSERLEYYRSSVDYLLDHGSAYYCYCTPERLREMTQHQRYSKQNLGYDGRCRDIAAPPNSSDSSSKVIRFKVPFDGETGFEDVVKGYLNFDNASLDDFIILKSDGYPTYHLANVVDDSNMKISHVLRADEWVSSTPKHILLYDALGLKKPKFAHLPIILGPDRSKLSKRHGSVSLLNYRDEGFLPEAMFNFLALIGWSLDDHTEILTQYELIDNFSLDRVSQAGAIFDRDKLLWMNGVYIRSIEDTDLADRLLKVLTGNLPNDVNMPISLDYVLEIVPLVRERLKTLEDAPDIMGFFFTDNISHSTDDLIQRGVNLQQTIDLLNRTCVALLTLDNWTDWNIETTLRSLVQETDFKAGQLFGSLRNAMTGRSAAPPLFTTMSVLGSERCMKRLKQAIHILEQVDDTGDSI